MATYYLDVDDEITSAASRIRSASDPDIAIVLPPGSRVATSRINFRLLAREAQARHRRLSIVAPEAATRALAASAGLPVFGTVGEYEAAQADGARGAAVGVGGETAAALDELAASMATAQAGSVVMDRKGAPRTARREQQPSPSRTAVPRKRGVSIAGIAFVALALIVLAGASVAAYLLVPTATIAITPREDDVAPMQLTVKVDPAAQAADPTNLVTPGLVQNFAVDSNGTFDATGRKVNKTAASGIVTFSSENTADVVIVPSGTQVWTDSGVIFLTQRAVAVPRADFGSGTRGTANVSVAAKNPGLSGNVNAGAINHLPGTIGPLVTVSNPSATSGGTETTIYLIAQSDVDSAKASLTSQLAREFNAQLTDPSQTSGNVQLFPDTSQLGAPSFDPDPASLVGQQVQGPSPKFNLVATANGTATAADISTVRSLAEQRLRSSVPSDRTLVEGSVDVQLGEGVASGTSVNVPVVATARTIQNLDVAALKNAIKGKSPADAKQYLSKFGKVDLSVSPDWLPNLPNYDFRIDIRVVTTASPSPSPLATPGNGASASPSPSAPQSRPPSPSGSAAP